MTAGRVVLAVLIAVIGALTGFTGPLWTLLALGPSDDQEVTHSLPLSLVVLAAGAALLVWAWLLLTAGTRSGKT